MIIVVSTGTYKMFFLVVFVVFVVFLLFVHLIFFEYIFHHYQWLVLSIETHFHKNKEKMIEN